MINSVHGARSAKWTPKFSVPPLPLTHLQKTCIHIQMAGVCMHKSTDSHADGHTDTGEEEEETETETETEPVT